MYTVKIYDDVTFTAPQMRGAFTNPDLADKIADHWNKQGFEAVVQWIPDETVEPYKYPLT